MSCGPDVNYEFKRGQKAFVHDGFEFESIHQPYLWDHLENSPEFHDLKQYLIEIDGDVSVQIVPESSILAVED